MIQINATQRLQAAAPAQLFSKLQKALGKYDTKKKGKDQIVTWHKGASWHSASLSVTYNTATEVVSIEYVGYGGDVTEMKDKDATRAWKKFKQEVDDWLDSGDATPEDRD